MNSESDAKGPVTHLLDKLARGEGEALDELFPMVYSELRRIARGQKRKSDSNPTLDTTGLLHEAYLKFAGSDRHLYNHRQHFYAVAAKAMRQILLDEARARVRKKRGGGVPHETLKPEDAALDEQAENMLALDQALTRLGSFQQRARQVVDYRFFGGLTEEETAQLLDVTPRTVRRDWAMARAWLAEELGSEDAL